MEISLIWMQIANEYSLKLLNVPIKGKKYSFTSSTDVWSWTVIWNSVVFTKMQFNLYVNITNKMELLIKSKRNIAYILDLEQFV